MPFQIICLRNKGFWSKVATIMAGFTMVIFATAAVFPLHNSANDTIQNSNTIITATAELEETQKDA